MHPKWYSYTGENEITLPLKTHSDCFQRAPFQSKKASFVEMGAGSIVISTPLPSIPRHQSREGFCAVRIMHHVRRPALVVHDVAWRRGRLEGRGRIGAWRMI